MLNFNIIGLIFSLLGSILLAISGANSILNPEKNSDDTWKIVFRPRALCLPIFSRFGFVLLSIGFLCQLIHEINL